MRKPSTGKRNGMKCCLSPSKPAGRGGANRAPRPVPTGHCHSGGFVAVHRRARRPLAAVGRTQTRGLTASAGVGGHAVTCRERRPRRQSYLRFNRREN